MALYDEYARFRDPELTEDERLDIEDEAERDRKIRNDPTLVHEPGGVRNRRDGIFVPYPLVQAHIGVAMERARAQFQGHPVMPEDQDVTIRFPGIDPMGNYSVIDMKFSQRIAAIEATLASRAPEVQAYARGLLDKCTDRENGGQFFEQYGQMKLYAQKHREVTRGAKLCLDEDGRRLMHQQARTMETEMPVELFDKLLQGIEYAAGVRTGPVPQDVADHYSRILHTDLDMKMVDMAQELYQTPEMKVRFQNFDNKMLQRAFSNPHNWGKSPAEVATAADVLDMDTYASAIPPYAVATAGRVIEPAFKDIERTSGGVLTRGDLIIIDGKTVKEKMLEDYTKGQGDPAKFNDFYQKNMRQAASEYTAAALMTGKRVEAFIPNKFGELPKEPTQITRDEKGYEPSPLKPEKFNAWQRYFAKRGYYKEKVARQAEYERMTAARERVKENVGSAWQKDRAGRLQEVEARSKQFTTIHHKELFFGKIMKDLKFVTEGADGQMQYDWGAMNSHMSTEYNATNAFHGFTRSEAADTCINYLAAQGHQFRDIMDPTKLQAEREAAADLFMKKAEAGDLEWLGQVFYAGSKALTQQAGELTRGVDLRDDRQLIAVLPEVEAMLHSAFSCDQELKTEACSLGYYKAAVADAGGGLERGNQLADALRDKLNDAALFAGDLLSGVRVQAALSDPTAKLSPDVSPGMATDLGVMRLALDHMKEGPSILEKSCTAEEMFSFRAAAAMNIDLREAVDKALETPQARAAIAGPAASGRLMGQLQVKDFKLDPALGRDGQPQHNVETRKVLQRNEDGSYGMAQVQVSHPATIPSVEFKLGEAFTPQAERKEPEMQAKAQQPKAPQRQNKPPQMGGPHR